MSPRKPRTEPKVVRQEVRWIPLPTSRCIKLDEHPYRVWTLYGPGRDDPNTPPTLPITPIHQHGAFLEDYLHDWMYGRHVGKGVFRYASRVTDEGTWVLIEYTDPKENPWVQR